MRFLLAKIGAGALPSLLAAGALALMLAPAGNAAGSGTRSREAAAWPRGVAIVGYSSPAALQAALARFPARVVRRIPTLRTVELRPRTSLPVFARAVSRLPGIAYVERLARRESSGEPALAPASMPGGTYEWQFAATHESEVDASVLRAASAITIAVIDTGADLTAPDLAAKSPAAYSVLTHSADVTDHLGHGTFVASLAAGSVTNGEGIAGFGGDAKLLVVQAADSSGQITSADEAAAIVYAVDHGARVLNLSFGGPQTSTLEQNAIDYAVSKGALVVAAAGNSFSEGSPTEYPAALLQPVGSNGQGGRGLVVGASTIAGARASFSNVGSYLSLAAPGESVFGANLSGAGGVLLAGSSAGAYGFGSGTSFATPEVAGAAALVWAANPSLSAQGVADILKQTASGHGSWTTGLGWGVVHVSAAVARAQGRTESTPGVRLAGVRTGRKVALNWSAEGAESYRLSIRKDAGPDRLLLPDTKETSATYELPAGHTYSFTVSAVNWSGFAMPSAPYAVRMTQLRTSLSLSRSRHRAGHLARFTVTLHVDGAAARAHRVVLEAFDGRNWRRFASVTTNRSGRAHTSVRLHRGQYRVRARFLGSEALGTTTSRALALRVR